MSAPQWLIRTIATVALGLAAIGVIPPASAAAVPSWDRTAVDYLSDHGWLDASAFDAYAPMARSSFTSLMHAAFGCCYRRDRGDLRAWELDAALVKALGQRSIADHLQHLTTPHGWSPDVGGHFGTEVVARELGLRHDWPPDQENREASLRQRITQADVAWAVWRAKTQPGLYSAGALANLALPDYTRRQRRIVDFAFGLVGKVYVWGGEWATKTPAGYPYGAQVHGGFDCSGFAWYVLRLATSSWDPPGRPYAGWDLPERTAADMAAGAPKRIRYRHLQPGDAVFFAPDGRDSPASTVYHMGIYLGNGWMIHSSGSRDGVSISSLGPGTYWHGQFAWGRRVASS